MTDIRTDGQTDRRTEISSPCRGCITCSAVKTCTLTSRLRLESYKLVSAGEANVSVSSRSRAFTSRAHPWCIVHKRPTSSITEYLHGVLKVSVLFCSSCIIAMYHKNKIVFFLFQYGSASPQSLAFKRLQSINQSINQSIDRSIDQSINQ